MNLKNLDVFSFMLQDCTDCDFEHQRFLTICFGAGFAPNETLYTYDLDPDNFMDLCDEYGVEDSPAFVVNGKVFYKGFSREELQNAIQTV